MQIIAVDHYKDLFRVTDVFPQQLVDAVLTTDWINKPWQRQEGQERWLRRRIDESSLPWMSDWNTYCEQLWPTIGQQLGIQITNYQGTAWWLDEPGFTCDLHTDGEMPGSMQLTWIGALPDLGTVFYNFKDPDQVRYRFPMQCNSGYIMINRANDQGYRHLQWHGMLTPVPAGTIRLNSYSWISPNIPISTT